MRPILACVVAVAFLGHTVAGQIPQSTGAATIELPPPPPPSQGGKALPPPSGIDVATQRQAIQRAKVNALDRYFAEQETSMAPVYETIRAELATAIDEYLLGAVVIEEVVEPGGMLTEVVRIEINKARLDGRLKMSVSAKASVSSAKMLTFVFVAREQASVTEFDATVTKTASKSRDATAKATAASAATLDADLQTASKDKTTSALNASQKESVKTSAVTVADKEAATRASEGRTKISGEQSTTSEQAVNTSTTLETTTVTSGSVVRRADDVKWRVSQAGEINQVLTGLFADVGYEVVEADYLEPESKGLLSIGEIRADFVSGDDIRPETLRNTARGAQEAGVPFVVYGTLDVGLRDIDPVSGLVRVTVTVTAKAIDVRGRFPRTVSSVGPVQFSGTGSDATVARSNALKLAAREAGKQLMADLDGRRQ